MTSSARIECFPPNDIRRREILLLLFITLNRIKSHGEADRTHFTISFFTSEHHKIPLNVTFCFMINQDENEMKLRIKCVLMSCQFEEQFENIKKKVDSNFNLHRANYDTSGSSLWITKSLHNNCSLQHNPLNNKAAIKLSHHSTWSLRSVKSYHLFFCFSIPNAETQNKHDTK